ERIHHQCISFSLPLPTTEPPQFDGYPFVGIWNAPTPVCKKLGIPLDTWSFKEVTTPAAVPGQFLTLFYTDHLGLYPYVNPKNNQQINGGIPQKGNLPAHLKKAYSDINYYIPSDTTPGLAVIDWEDWRPLWDRNWGAKDIYRQLSIAYAQMKDPSWLPSQATADAKKQFQTAARNYMEKTLKLGISQRPKRLWGFYLFPDCYNYGWETPGYTGQCSDLTKSQNDQLLWLWESSTALYPSVYLPGSLKNSPNAALFVRNRVQEAVRVAALPKRPFTVPIYVYSWPMFSNQNDFLSMDLISSIGETAALGASGSVLWGASASCEALSTYLTSTLNPYIANVTAAAKLCSDVLCQGNGRCVRKDYNSNVYLNQNTFRLQESQGKYMAIGIPSSADLLTLADKFTCQCYKGRSCSPKLSRPRTPMVIPLETCPSQLYTATFSSSCHKRIYCDRRNSLPCYFVLQCKCIF
uniref:Hyaluronidase n=1 Tax=Esox lucius TaxID=8010 RepID=A0A3P8ZJ82_ESOLU